MPDASLGGSGGSGGSSGSGGGQVDASIDVDTPDIDTPEGCLWPNKICDGKCVAYDDPDYGCTQDTCDPCPINDNTEYGCVNHECIVTGCKPGYYSCNGDPTDGCETDIWSADNCGTGQDGCGHPCSPSNTDSASCLNGQCTIVKCKELFADCNHDPNDGCETNLRDIHNCGECGKECTVSAGSTPTCASGVCKADQCPPGKADCDSNPADCETDITTTQNCGACGNVCAGPNVNQWACVASGGQYACQITACAQNWGNCNGQIGDGCEVNLNSATDHCGSCGGKCSTHNATAQACNNGQCIPTCIDGFKDCNGPRPGATDDGCETNVRTPQNCGACGTTCAPAHATPDCSLGTCGIKSCESGYADCDNKPGTGCEIFTSTNPSHCGGCNLPCSTNHVSPPTCTGGQCSGGCESGWADCDDNKRSNGCETDISTNVAHCGGCTRSCSTNHVSSPTCTGGQCTGACAPNFGDCNSNKLKDGCETSFVDVQHCGSCTKKCEHLNATWTCALVGTPVCQITGCTSPFANCNGDHEDGCETNTNTNPNHCGKCNLPCSTNHVSPPTCTGGQCSGGCESGWADCDDNKRSNGCETDISTNVAHCGGCTRSCSTNHVSSPTCTGGQCTGACESGWGDCNDDKLYDGCETDLNNDSNNCGTCKKSCLNDFQCVNGQCRCTSNENCGNDGTCNTNNGLCTCDDGDDEITCQVGQVCNTDKKCVTP